MERFKIQLAENDGVTLQVTEMNAETVEIIVREVSLFLERRLSCLVHDFYRGIVPQFWQECKHVSGDFCPVAESSLSEEYCYIIWGESEIDLVSVSSLAQYFDYFWYQHVDDIFIISLDMETIIFIRHDGAVFKYLRS